jgi:hypothetical protein
MLRDQQVDASLSRSESIGRYCRRRVKNDSVASLGFYAAADRTASTKDFRPERG